MQTSTTTPTANPRPADLTSDNYWDHQWDGFSQRRRRQVTLRSLINSIFRVSNAPLYDHLALLLNQQSQHRNGAQQRVLEVGCAPGRVLDEVMQRCPQHKFYGVDFSEVGIRDTQTRFQSREFRPEVFFADVRKFHPDQLFDYVFSCGLIEHFTDPVPMLQDHMRLCLPGGRVVVTVPNYSGTLQRICMTRLDPEAWKSHNTAVMCEHALRDIGTRAGLKNVSTGKIGKQVLRAISKVNNPANVALQTAARAYSVCMRLAPQAVTGPLYFWMTGQVSE